MGDHLNDMVRGAALFVGLHCLNRFTETTDEGIDMAKNAMQVMATGFQKYWGCSIKEAIEQKRFATSGTIDDTKLVMPPDFNNDAEVRKCVRDLKAFPLAIAFLEMSAGGVKMCLMSTFLGVASLMNPTCGPN